MNNLENYKKIIEDVFGKGSTTFDTKSKATNNIIGALNSNNYQEFNNCFKARLRRLNTIYSTKDFDRKNLIDQVNLISKENNWAGAYSELAAYDFMNFNLPQRNYLHSSVKLNQDVLNARTFAKELGKKGHANLDGFISDYNIYFDVKSLKDNISEILNGIHKEILKDLTYKDLTIVAECSLDISYHEFESKRNSIRNDLVEQLSKIDYKKTANIKSNVTTGLMFKLLWGSGVVTTEHTYHPHRHAMKTHKLVFDYSDKFIKDSPFILVFVVFPWFNGIITTFNNSNKEFYRTFSRRIFCQYIHDKTSFKHFDSRFTGQETIYDISKKISGILFLEDNSILSKTPDFHNINATLCTNPNADNPLTRLFNCFCDELKVVRVDFEFDNY
jgi:hypothetical protein